ncbi:MAG: uracil-DNA glycosylase [Pyrinomonadaceae bacterium]
MMHDALVKDKQRFFAELASEAQVCVLCENLRQRTAVLSELNGNLNSQILFVAEAPGRQGGDRTRVPLVGDASGANFKKFINSIGLEREDVFVTNSVLCNPRKESGANRKPTRLESHNCSAFLRRQLEVLEPKIIVTLGSVALEALKTIEYHELNLKNNAGTILEWNNRLLVPLYHPSPQVLASHRRMQEQLEDYKSVAIALQKTNEQQF